MRSNGILQRAFDPRQYDFEDVLWSQESGLSSPTREWFWDNLKHLSDLWQRKSVLDVGCGTGWFLNTLRENGADPVEGFDPSHKSVKLARELYPQIEVNEGDLLFFSTHRRYDVIFSIMSFAHIADVSQSFKKIHALLNEGGHFILTTPSYDYFRTPRHDYDVAIEDLNPDEYVTQVKRPHWGLIAEVVRKTSVYEKAGTSARFSLVREVGLRPTARLIERLPRYKAVREDVLVDLFHFKR